MICDNLVENHQEFTQTILETLPVLGYGLSVPTKLVPWWEKTIYVRGVHLLPRSCALVAPVRATRTPELYVPLLVLIEVRL